MTPVAPETRARMHEEEIPRWRLWTADLTGVPAHRLDDPAVLESVVVECFVEALGQAPRRWIRHRFDPQGVSLVGSGPALRIALHTWPELRAATLDVWSNRPNVGAVVERCAGLLGAHVAHRRGLSSPMHTAE